MAVEMIALLIADSSWLGAGGSRKVTVATEDCSGRPDLVNDNPSNTGGVPGSPAKSFKIISKVSKVRGFVDFFFVLA
jgi:hypothetical protein